MYPLLSQQLALRGRQLHVTALQFVHSAVMYVTDFLFYWFYIIRNHN